MPNSYVGAPTEEQIAEIASKSLEEEVRYAIDTLGEDENDNFPHVISLLRACLGETDE